jgi:hypothetical protein
VEAHEQENAGKLLAYRLFGIQKNKTGEKPTQAQPVKEEKKEEKVV